MANAGLLVPQLGFLERLREVTDRLGSCSSSTSDLVPRLPRAAPNSASASSRSDHPGKIIGGGLAVGAFGGRSEVMNAYDHEAGRERSAMAAPSTPTR